MTFRKLKKFVIEKITAEIPDTLSYHGVHHTIYVLNACNAYIRRLKINEEDARVLRTGALMHDIGIMWDYFNHEEISITYVKDILPNWNYSPEEINKICGLIQSTKLPQRPTNLLEEIICDSDVDYLGTPLFYTIGNTLYEEFLKYKVVKDEESWDRVQVRFLMSHKYHTDFAKKNREPIKTKYLKEIIHKWGWEDEYLVE